MTAVRQVRMRVKTPVIFIRLPPHVWIGLSIVMSLAVLVSSVIIIARHEISNPFAAYDDLFGDNAMQAALTRGFTCRETRLVDEPQHYCALTNPDPVFSRQSMRLAGSIAGEITFSLRENALRLGDLIFAVGAAGHLALLRNGCRRVA